MPSALLRKAKKAPRPLLSGDHDQEGAKERSPRPISAEEQKLENILFGGSSQRQDHGSLENCKEPSKPSVAVECDISGDSEAESDAEKKRPAWVDDDDENVLVSLASEKRVRKLRKTEDDDVVTGREYTERLRERFASTYSAHQGWAQVREEDDGDVLQWAGPLTKKGTRRLPQSLLEVTRVKDANQHEYAQSAIQCTIFHPNAAVMLTAGLDKTLRLFQIDGKENAKIQSVFIKELPIQSADFSADGTRIYMSGRRPFYYVYDMQSGAIDKVHRLQGRTERSLESMYVSPNGKHIVFLGDNGSLLLVDTHTNRLVDTLKMNGTSRAVAFNGDGSQMFSHGGDGQVYVWDMATRACVHTFADEGCFNGTALSVSKDSRLLATGADSGVVNIYDVNTCLQSETPAPLKAVMNLTTRVDALEFNHDGQALALASTMKKDSLKMIHVPSLTAFSNWPTAQTPVRYAHSVAFSPHSGYFAFGNDRGRVLLYRLNHYAQS